MLKATTIISQSSITLFCILIYETDASLAGTAVAQSALQCDSNRVMLPQLSSMQPFAAAAGNASVNDDAKESAVRDDRDTITEDGGGITNGDIDEDDDDEFEIIPDRFDRMCSALSPVRERSTALPVRTSHSACFLR